MQFWKGCVPANLLTKAHLEYEFEDCLPKVYVVVVVEFQSVANWMK